MIDSCVEGALKYIYSGVFRVSTKLIFVLLYCMDLTAGLYLCDPNGFSVCFFRLFSRLHMFINWKPKSFGMSVHLSLKLRHVQPAWTPIHTTHSCSCPLASLLWLNTQLCCLKFTSCSVWTHLLQCNHSQHLDMKTMWNCASCNWKN